MQYRVEIMTKKASIFAFLFSCIIFSLLLAGCATSNKDPLAAYQRMTAKEIFDKGVVALKKHHYSDAAKDFDALNSLYPFGDYSERAQYYIIYAYYNDDQPAMALAAAGRYIQLYPRSDHVDYAYYMRGVINMGRKYDWFQRAFGADRASRDLTYLRQAFVDFSEVVRLFPKSQYTPQAHEYMLIIRNILAQHELEIVQFYYQRRAFLGAANRANYLITYYPGAPQVIPAFYLLAKSYEALGEDALAEKARQVLIRSYPDSVEAKELKQEFSH